MIIVSMEVVVISSSSSISSGTVDVDIQNR